MILAKSDKGKAQSAHQEDVTKKQTQDEEMLIEPKDENSSETRVKSQNIDIELDGEYPEDAKSAEKGDIGKKGGAEAEELAQQRDKYLRLAAEYDNFRKRSKLEKEMTYQQARVDAITRLLPVYDNLERALKMECSDEAFFKGIEMTMTSLNEILENMDVKLIPAVGETFDPNRHNAVMTIENPELGEKIVAEEYQKGFMLGEKVIRFSTVVVAN